MRNMRSDRRENVPVWLISLAADWKKCNHDVDHELGCGLAKAPQLTTANVVQKTVFSMKNSQEVESTENSF